jgi:hypothetical protein
MSPSGELLRIVFPPNILRSGLGTFDVIVAFDLGPGGSYEHLIIFLNNVQLSIETLFQPFSD